MIYNMNTFWDFYFLAYADGRQYEFLLDLAILRVNAARSHHVNQSTRAAVTLCQISHFAYDLNNWSSYRPYY